MVDQTTEFDGKCVRYTNAHDFLKALVGLTRFTEAIRMLLLNINIEPVEYLIYHDEIEIEIIWNKPKISVIFEKDCLFITRSAKFILGPFKIEVIHLGLPFDISVEILNTLVLKKCLSVFQEESLV
jgi:hypothetical protein